jgi:hypothetical protein
MQTVGRAQAVLVTMAAGEAKTPARPTRRPPAATPAPCVSPSPVPRAPLRAAPGGRRRLHDCLPLRPPSRCRRAAAALAHAQRRAGW